MLCLWSSDCGNLFQAKKEAVTDGVKRALRNFGNILGLCLYEKSFTQEVIKIKPQPVVREVHQLCAYITTLLTPRAITLAKV
jgi:recombination DNA repair RAD52 pathway protein